MARREDLREYYIEGQCVHPSLIPQEMILRRRSSAPRCLIFATTLA